MSFAFVRVAIQVPGRHEDEEFESDPRVRAAALGILERRAQPPGASHLIYNEAASPSPGAQQ
eukprot:scaffold65567_cov31-Prasinocladus_malaysianus.AAC.1